MNISKHSAEYFTNNKPIAFEWFNNRFGDNFFLNLLNHIFPLSLFIAHKYKLSSRILVNRSVTFLYNHSIDENYGLLTKELKRWFIVFQNSKELAPIDQYYLYVLKRYCRTYSMKERNMEDELISNTLPIAIGDTGREAFFQIKKAKKQFERNINVFRIVNDQLDYQPQSTINNSVNHYFNSFAVYDIANTLVLEYLEFIQNIGQVIEKSKDVADLVLLNSSFKFYIKGNMLSKDRNVNRMCRITRKYFATKF